MPAFNRIANILTFVLITIALFVVVMFYQLRIVKPSEELKAKVESYFVGDFEISMVEEARVNDCYRISYLFILTREEDEYITSCHFEEDGSAYVSFRNSGMHGGGSERFTIAWLGWGSVEKLYYV